MYDTFHKIWRSPDLAPKILFYAKYFDPDTTQPELKPVGPL